MTSSKMHAEALQAPDCVADLLARDRGLYAALGAELRERPLAGVLTVARGSTAHAARMSCWPHPRARPVRSCR